jgi:hypothetical protein
MKTGRRGSADSRNVKTISTIISTRTVLKNAAAKRAPEKAPSERMSGYSWQQPMFRRMLCVIAPFALSFEQFSGQGTNITSVPLSEVSQCIGLQE